MQLQLMFVLQMVIITRVFTMEYFVFWFWETTVLGSVYTNTKFTLYSVSNRFSGEKRFDMMIVMLKKIP